MHNKILLSLKIESPRRESTYSFILFAQGNEQILILILIMILILFFFNFSEFELLCPSSMTKRLMSNQLDRASTSIALNLDLAVGSGIQHQPFDPESLVTQSSTCTGMSALAINLAASDSESKSWHSLPFRTAESRLNIAEGSGKHTSADRCRYFASPRDSTLGVRCLPGCSCC